MGKLAKDTFFLIGLSILLSAAVSCGRQQAEWKGTIEDVNGVELIKNPREPMYGERIYVLEEDLSIGKASDRQEHAFSEIIDVGADNEENIYVLDFKQSHVRVFDKVGGYLRTIGKMGQGPGEIQRPTSLYITPGNELLVNDRGARFLHFFALGGAYLRSRSLARWTSFSRPKVDAHDNIVVRVPIFAPEKVTFVLKKFDAGLNELCQIFSYEMDNTPGIYDVHPPQCFWDLGRDDCIVWGYSDKYELNVLDPGGQVARRIIKDYEPVLTTEEEKKEWIESAFGEKGVPPDVKVNWPKYHNAFQSLRADDEGRIIIQTYEKTPDASGSYCDVFDRQGKFIVKIPVKSEPRVWKKERFYTIEENEDGYQCVKRYRITWLKRPDA